MFRKERFYHPNEILTRLKNSIEDLPLKTPHPLKSVFTQLFCLAELQAVRDRRESLRSIFVVPFLTERSFCLSKSGNDVVRSTIIQAAVICVAVPDGAGCISGSNSSNGTLETSLYAKASIPERDSVQIRVLPPVKPGSKKVISRLITFDSREESSVAAIVASSGF